MRYKPKNSAALHIALGGLPAQMPVKVDADIEVTAKTGRRASQGDGLARKFGDNDAAGSLSRQRSKSEQGRRRDTHVAEGVAPTVVS